jgi:hypothetical protein
VTAGGLIILICPLALFLLHLGAVESEKLSKIPFNTIKSRANISIAAFLLATRFVCLGWFVFFGSYFMISLFGSLIFCGVIIILSSIIIFLFRKTIIIELSRTF